jgi:hypothetical protein
MLGQSAGGLLATDHFWIVAIGLGTLLWALYTGKPIWKLLQTAAVIALLLVIILMTWVAVGEFGDKVFSAKPQGMPFMIGLDLVIAMPISWMPLVADYARFAKKTAPASWNTWWGYFLISSWMYLLGLTATLATGAGDPAALILQVMGRIGLALPALVMVIFSSITSDFPDVYSVTCSMLTISRRVGSTTIMWGGRGSRHTGGVGFSDGSIREFSALHRVHVRAALRCCADGLFSDPRPPAGSRSSLCRRGALLVHRRLRRFFPLLADR